MALVGTDGTTYTLGFGINPYNIVVNGVVDPHATEVIALLYKNHRVWYMNKDHSWFSRGSFMEGWQPDSDPRVGAPPVGNLPPTYDTLQVTPWAGMNWISGFLLDGAEVTHIFWGTFWNTAANPSASDLNTKMGRVYSGPYYAGLQEYGIFNKPKLVNSLIVQDATTPDLSGVTIGDPQIANFLTRLLDAGTIPVPVTDAHILFVVLPPASKAYTGNVAGYHNSFLYHGARIVYAAAFYYAVDMRNNFTRVMTHEVCEAMNNPYIQVYASWMGSLDQANDVDELNDVYEVGEVVTMATGNIFEEGFYSNRTRSVIIPTSE